VVVCDVKGIGGLVTSSRWEHLRHWNFGMRTLIEPMSAEVLAREIALYDPVDAARVAERTRREASLAGQIASFTALYREVLEMPPTVGDEARATAHLMREMLRPWHDSWRLTMEQKAAQAQIASLNAEVRGGKEREAQAAAAFASLKAKLEREVRERERERRQESREARARAQRAAAEIAGLKREAERRAAIAEALQNSATIRLRDRVHRIPALRAAARVVVRWVAGWRAGGHARAR
jgi:hypothetical protein